MKYSFFNNRNVARKNVEKSKNPVLRELLQQPPKTTCTQEQQDLSKQQQNTPSPENFSEIKSLWNNLLQLELDLKNFDSG